MPVFSNFEIQLSTMNSHTYSNTLICLLIITTVRLMAQVESNYPIQPVSFVQVSMEGSFWEPRLITHQQSTLAYTFQQCESTGRVRNFDIAAGKTEGAFQTVYSFDDSDLYKIIEGAAYSLQVKPNPALEAYVDSLILLIRDAQEPDGYLYTWRTIAERQKRANQWTAADTATRNYQWGRDERWVMTDLHSHELYNIGHMYEAATAYFLATGKRILLDIAIKSANLVYDTFGWGKLEKTSGHQEIELGLIKLYLVTNDQRYVDLASYFLEARGYGTPDKAYMQNHQKVTQQTEIVGHAVRAAYMFAAMADVAALTNRTEYLKVLERLWSDAVGKKWYVTGGIGSTGSNEGFGAPYDLPNYSAYNETCSSIAFVYWNHRMFLLTGEGKYLDALERTLYNALNAGLSLAGDRFFYPNPLESRKNVERSPWFTCACCPSNIARFFPALPGYVYGQKGDQLYVNLFANSSAVINLHTTKSKKALPVKITQQTRYPWDGKIVLNIDPDTKTQFDLLLRVPGWAREEAVPSDLYSFQIADVEQVRLSINDKSQAYTIKNGFITIQRKWSKGDKVILEMPMPVQRILSHPKVQANHGRIALQRGPLMYALEGKDQPLEQVAHVMVKDDAHITSQFEKDLLGGVQTLTFTGFMVHDAQDIRPIELKAIPYYAWANRGRDNMIVWISNNSRDAIPLAKPSIVSKSKISSSPLIKGELQSVVDQWLPKNSADQSNPYVHWWPKFGGEEWIQFDFDQAYEIGTIRAYWFDDEERDGGCRVPQKWKLSYLENGEWKYAYSYQAWSITKDNWSDVQFEPVKTSAIRLEIELQEGFSAGIHELEIF